MTTSNSLLLTCLLFFFCSGPLQGNERLIDSLKQILATTELDSNRYEICREIGDAYFEGDFDSLLVYYHQALGLAQKTNNFRGEISTLRSFAYVHKYRKNDYELAANYFQKALDLTKEQKDTIATTYLLHDFGELYRSQGDYLTAIDYFFQSNYLAEARQHTHLLTRTWYSLGLLYSEEKNHQEALAFYKKAILLTNDSTYARMKGRLLNNMGKTYLDVQQQSKADSSFQQALQIFQRLNDNDAQVDVYLNMADNHQDLGKYAEAIIHYEKALSLNRIIDNKNRAAKILSGLAATYLKQQSYNKAIDTAQEGLQNVQEVDTYLHISELQEVLSKCYTHLGQYKKALTHQQLALSAQDSLQQKATSKKLARMNLLYEKEKRNVEIEQLKAKNANQLLKTNQSKFQIRLLSLFALFCLALGILFWNYQRRKQLEQYKQLRIRLTNDLHDNISTSLNHIKIMANKISGDTPLPPEQKKRYAKKIKSISKEVVHNMHDLIWGLDDQKVTLHDLIVKMMDHANQVLETSGVPYEIDNEILTANPLIQATVKNNIYAIFKEAINNIVKHTQSEKVTIVFLLEKEVFQMHIKNDTTVLLDKTYSTKIGLKSIRKRAADMLGNINIDHTEQYFSISLSVGI